MQCYRFTLRPLSAFATELMGDTLFGQLCWAIRNRQGEERLKELLRNYRNNPFAILSDAFPSGYLPLPKLPVVFFDTIEGMDRKAIKKRNWLPVEAFYEPLPKWLAHSLSDRDIADTYGDNRQAHLREMAPQPHNSINSMTGTTGETGFAPYSSNQYWYHTRLELEGYALLDESQTGQEEIRQCLEDIGLFGYGRDATIGMGKFEITEWRAFSLPGQQRANACITLACSAPQGLGYEAEHSYYQTFTRFGRHGDRAVAQTGRPFKNPLLLTKAGAVFSVRKPEKGYLGQSLGGEGELSNTLPETIHQGYAPTVAIQLPKERARL